MASAAITVVPTSTGMNPKEPSCPCCPSRIAVIGRQSIPKRNSTGDTIVKKRSESKISVKTIPSVVRIATAEQAMSSHRKIRSVALRAWNACEIGLRA